MIGSDQFVYIYLLQLCQWQWLLYHCIMYIMMLFLIAMVNTDEKLLSCYLLHAVINVQNILLRCSPVLFWVEAFWNNCLYFAWHACIASQNIEGWVYRELPLFIYFYNYIYTVLAGTLCIMFRSGAIINFKQQG